jgi:cytochrome c-type biogenesis protein CcmH
VRSFAALLIYLLSILPAPAVQPDEILQDATLESRARALSQQLRCMVCQNQSIDDSDAPLARDLRLLVRERLNAGDGDGQVLDFLVSRYGEFVLLKPPFHAATALLWVLPPALLFAGAVVLVLAVRRRRTAVIPPIAELDNAEHDRLAALIQRDKS